MITHFFQIIIIVWLKFCIQLFWNQQLHSHCSITSENDNILDFSPVWFANTRLPHSHKVEIENVYELSDFLSLKPPILYKQWQYYQPIAWAKCQV